SFSGNPVLIGHGNNVQGWYVQAATNGTVYLAIGNTFKQSVNLVLTTGVWQHLVITWDGSNVRWYLNGTLKDTIALSNTMSDYAGDLLLGKYSNGGNKYNGALDDVRI